jgi:hypothetical protein
LHLVLCRLPLWFILWGYFLVPPRYNIMWPILSVICDRAVVSSTNKPDRYDIIEILLKVVVIGTDCIGSCKSNYYTITTTTAPKKLHFDYGIKGNIFSRNPIYEDMYSFLLDTTLCDQVCQWLATGRWFPPLIKLTVTI